MKTSSVVWSGFNSFENKRLPGHLVPRPTLRVEAGDVLMTRAGPNSRVGVVALVHSNSGKLMLSDKLYRLIPIRGVTGQFLALALSSEGTQRNLGAYKTGLAESQTNISQAIVRRLIFPFPSESERDTICLGTIKIAESIAVLLLGLRKLEEAKRGLLHDLLSGQVRVSRKVEEAAE